MEPALTKTSWAIRWKKNKKSWSIVSPYFRKSLLNKNRSVATLLEPLPQPQSLFKPWRSCIINNSSPGITYAFSLFFWNLTKEENNVAESLEEKLCRWPWPRTGSCGDQERQWWYGSEDSAPTKGCTFPLPSQTCQFLKQSKRVLSKPENPTTIPSSSFYPLKPKYRGES